MKMWFRFSITIWKHSHVTSSVQLSADGIAKKHGWLIAAVDEVLLLISTFSCYNFYLGVHLTAETQIHRCFRDQGRQRPRINQSLARANHRCNTHLFFFFFKYFFFAEYKDWVWFYIFPFKFNVQNTWNADAPWQHNRRKTRSV